MLSFRKIFTLDRPWTDEKRTIKNDYVLKPVFWKSSNSFSFYSPQIAPNNKKLKYVDLLLQFIWKFFNNNMEFLRPYIMLQFAFLEEIWGVTKELRITNKRDQKYGYDI